MIEALGIRVPELTADEVTFVKTLRNVCDQLLNAYLEKQMSEAVLDIAVNEQAVEATVEAAEPKKIDFAPLEKKLAELTSFLIDEYGFNVDAIQNLNVALIYDKVDDGVKMRFALQEIPRLVNAAPKVDA